MPVATLCAHRLARSGGFAGLAARLAGSVEEAAAHGSSLVVFPEYGAMELTCLAPGIAPDAIREQIAAIQPWHDAWVDTHAALARLHGLFILAGSFPRRHPDGSITNRAWLCGPDGVIGYQDKVMMTRFEREQWGISGGGKGIRVWDLGWCKAAVCICYDIEFPLLVRPAAEAGAELLLVPSDTDGWHGYWRVRAGAQARAMENQCYVAMAPLVGTADWSDAIDVNVGRAGAFGPIDTGFPEDGVLALGGDGGGLLHVEFRPRRLHSVRRHGQNRNFLDWPASRPEGQEP